MVDYERRIKELPKGSQILHEPLLNKGTGFTAKERGIIRSGGAVATYHIDHRRTKR